MDTWVQTDRKDKLVVVLYQYRFLSFFVSDFVKRISSWKADSFSDTLEIPCFLRKAVVHNIWPKSANCLCYEPRNPSDCATFPSLMFLTAFCYHPA